MKIGGMKPSVLVAIVVAVLLAAGGALLVFMGQGGGLKDYESAARARWQAMRASEAPAQVFRATICAKGPCVLVEVSGLTFVVGAGRGAAEGLREHGGLRRDLDGVLVSDLSFASIAGLAGLGDAILDAGRADPLPVFGPQGLVAVVDGTNLMLSGGGVGRLRLAVGDEGEDQGVAGKVVYDSGVVTILAFPADGGGRVYRIETPQQSLVVAGCTARAADVVAATRGARQAAGIIAASSEKLLGIERRMAREVGAPPATEPGCMSVEEATEAIRTARLGAALIVPLAPDTPDSDKAWKASATIPKDLKVEVAGPGTILDLSDPKPAIRPRQAS